MRAHKRSLVAAGVVLLFGAAGRYANGFVYSGAEAKELISALSGSALYLGSAMTGGSATTLALMLTLVGLVKRADEQFDGEMYKRVSLVSLLSTIILAGSVFLLLLLTIPVGEFERLPSSWYPRLYDVMYALVISLSALLVATVVLLYSTINGLIAQITPTDDI